MSILSWKNGYGGYRLNRCPEDYSVGEILRLTEGTLAPVACLDNKSNKCEKAASCSTFPMWEGLSAVTAHSQLSQEELYEQGIKPNTIRLSVGTEHIDDIIADLEKWFEAIK